MKSFVACIVLALAVAAFAELTDEQKAKVKEFSTACKTETGVKPELVENAKTKKEFVEGDSKFDDYMTCFMKKIKFIKDDGTCDVDHIKTKIPSDVDHTKAVSHVEKCCGIHDGEATARKIMQCLVEGKYKITVVAA